MSRRMLAPYTESPGRFLPMYSGIIYKATNLSNGKVYIGQTTRSLEERKHAHEICADKTTTLFAFAIREFGIDGFKWEQIDEVQATDPMELKAFLAVAENYHIMRCRSFESSKGYNLIGVKSPRTIRIKGKKPKVDEDCVVAGIHFAAGQARPIALYSTEGEFLQYYPSMGGQDQHARWLAHSDKYYHTTERACAIDKRKYRGVVLHLQSRVYPPKKIIVENQ